MAFDARNGQWCFNPLFDALGRNVSPKVEWDADYECAGDARPRHFAVTPFEVELPAVRVLEQRHVEAALARARADVDGCGGLTLWIDKVTVGIGIDCFREMPKMKRVSRILTRREPESIVAYASQSAAVLGALIRKIGMYEPDLVDLIHACAAHNLDKMHRIGERAFFGAFQGCTRLTEVTLPNTLTHMGDYAFYGCTTLKDVTLPNKLTHIGIEAFRGCTGLTEVTLPNTLVHIGNNAFGRCIGLTEVTLPDTLAHIGDCAFYGCTGLTEVTLPNTLRFVGDGAFAECTRLAAVTLPRGRTCIMSPNAFFNCPWSDAEGLDESDLIDDFEDDSEDDLDPMYESFNSYRHRGPPTHAYRLV